MAFGVADPPHSGCCLARATAEAVDIAPGPGIDQGMGPEIDLGRADGRKDVHCGPVIYPRGYPLRDTITL